MNNALGKSDNKPQLALSLRPIWLLLVLPSILYVSIYWLWHSNRYYEIQGDEPHYLLTADSLVRDHDLYLTNNYYAPTPVSWDYGAMLTGWHLEHLRNGFSIHGLGLPFLLALPYWFRAVTGAKLFMALVCGLGFPFLFYRIARRAIGSDEWAILIAFVIAVGYPFVAANSQVYPDLLAGLVILYGAMRLVEGYATRQISTFAVLSTCLGAAYLPWLHLRLLAPACVLLAATLGLVMKAGYLRRRLVVRVAFPLLLFCLSCSLLAAYNLHAFGSATGPYGGGGLVFDIRKTAMVFLGLIWDSEHGILMQHPFFLISLLGFVPFVRHNPRGAIVVGLLYLSATLPNAMHPNWYGGYSFVGRFGWAAVGLWIFPLAFAAKEVLEWRLGSAVLFSCAVGSLLFQGLVATLWLTHDDFLYSTGPHPIWMTVDPYTRLLRRSLIDQPYLLPAYKDFVGYLHHWPNLIYLLGGLVLIASGFWFRLRRLRPLAWSLSVALLVLMGAGLILFSSPSPAEPLRFTADQLYGMVGVVEGSTRVAQDGEPGLLSFGPYVRLPSNAAYEFTLRYQGASRRGSTWDVFLDSKAIVAEGKLAPSAETEGVLRQTVVLPATVATKPQFELRVHYGGRGPLVVEGLEIRPVPLPPPEP